MPLFSFGMTGTRCRPLRTSAFRLTPVARHAAQAELAGNDPASRKEPCPAKPTQAIKAIEPPVERGQRVFRSAPPLHATALIRYLMPVGTLQNSPLPHGLPVHPSGGLLPRPRPGCGVGPIGGHHRRPARRRSMIYRAAPAPRYVETACGSTPALSRGQTQHKTARATQAGRTREYTARDRRLFPSEQPVGAAWPMLTSRTARKRRIPNRRPS